MSELVWISLVSSFAGAAAFYLLQAALNIWLRPVLVVEVSQNGGFRVERLVNVDGGTMPKSQRPGVWLRVRVVNRGRSVSRGVRVFMTDFADAGDAPLERLATDPAPLDWAHLPRGSAIDIPPGLGFFADFVLAVGYPSWVESELRSGSRIPEFERLLLSRSPIRCAFTPTHQSGLGEMKIACLEVGGNLNAFQWRH
ncbi:hypothetical protein ACLF3G_08995 [Falsiroseomonas sp. HC035]|uniref:hypothetical protein n=1 Tax=Falsiroseomonas sp. HC035 TaxID=3390999 RepID=UPI003D31CFF5